MDTPEPRPQYRSRRLDHLCYIEASIEMHAQMSAVSTLISILGYIPNASVN
uniref:Uncharacterized protein n=1 Tax=Rhizobium rhizogenes TaxID=359 RepID=A0A2Z2PRF2_RHIRH|nr:transcriptional repressor TraM [Rhizobium rhizogenes]ASK44252.1 hypothetical protein [Rhizobium rhizogenes]